MAGMNWVSGLVLYILIWWVTLFAILPIGGRSEPKPDAVTGWRGVPDTPRVWMKAGLTTVAAAVLWLVAFGVIESGWFSFRDGYFAAPRGHG